MRATIQITNDHTALIGGVEHRPTSVQGEARNPFTLGPECTFEYVVSDLMGPTILVFDSQGDPLYGVNVRRPGMYVIDEQSHTYVNIPIQPREPVHT